MVLQPGRALPDFVRLHAAARPTSIALQDAASGRALSYAEVHRAVGAACSILSSLGIVQGNRIAALSRNSIELVILQLGCARIGAILVPFNWRLSSTELSALAKDCSPSLLVGDECLELLGRTQIPTLTLREFGLGLTKVEAEFKTGGDASQPSLMLYTSGSTGRPKGVMLTEANLFATAVHFTVMGEVGPNSAFLVDVPMFHVLGMVTNVRPALMMGGKVVISSGFDPAATLERLADPDLAITHYFCVPLIAAMLRCERSFEAASLRHLRALFTGGAPHPATEIRKWLGDGVLAVDGYGMTEAGTVIGMPLNRSIIDKKAGSIGLIPPTVEYRIVGLDEKDVDPGEVGELIIRGPNLFVGYWNNPEATSEAFTKDGYFRTGDLVRQDEEGFFFIVDRKKDMFISGGENVYPAEIESVLRSCPGVIEAAVVGVPDERWGEVGHAFVVLEKDVDTDESSLKFACAKVLAKYKLPHRIYVVTDLPRTGSGKISKVDLRESIAQPEEQQR